jgi:hypothetical protein
MKRLCLSLVLFLPLSLLAQNDSVRKIEPGQQTSFDRYGSLMVAIGGLLLVMGLRFWFKRKRQAR